MAYSKIEWNSGDVITAEKLNHIEEAVEDVSSSVDSMTPSIAKIDNIESTVEDLSAEIASARNYNSAGTANTLGGRIDELVRISNTQPGGNNEIWVNSGNGVVETEVPTYQEFNNLIVNQNTQPSAASNRIWIPTSGGEEVEVPDMGEFNKLKNSNAPEYSNNAIYAVGEYVFHNGNLYRCQTAITTAETWTAAHWAQVVFGNEVSDLKSYYVTTNGSFATLINAGADVNDYTTPGNYRVGSSTIAAQIANLPLARAGRLTVDGLTAQTGVFQKYATTTGAIYTRVKQNDVWGEWEEIAKTSHIASEAVARAAADNEIKSTYVYRNGGKQVKPENLSFVTFGNNLYNGHALYVGRINGGTGELRPTSTSYVTTDFIPLNIMSGTYLLAEKLGNLNHNAYGFYDANLGFISGAEATETNALEIPINAEYVRVSYTSGTTPDQIMITRSNNTTAVPYEAFSFKISEDAIDTNGIKNEITDVKATYVYRNGGAQVKPENLSFVTFGNNLYDGHALYVGRIDGQTGELKPQSSSYLTTDFIPLNLMSGTYLLAEKNGNLNHNAYGFYDLTRNFISGVEATETNAVEIPAGAEYVRVSYTSSTTPDQIMITRSNNTTAVSYEPFSFEIPTNVINNNFRSSLNKTQLGNELNTYLSNWTAAGGSQWDSTKSQYNIPVGGSISKQFTVEANIAYLIVLTMSTDPNPYTPMLTIDSRLVVSLGDASMNIFGANDGTFAVRLTPTVGGTVNGVIASAENWTGALTSVSIRKVVEYPMPSLQLNNNGLYLNGYNTGFGTGLRKITNDYNDNGRVFYGTVNTSIGYHAQDEIDTGRYNNAYGYGSQRNMTNGSSNNAYGTHTQEDATTAMYNNAFGSSSQRKLTIGCWNVAMGNESQRDITDGCNNVGIGRRAQNDINSGQRNIAIGALAGFICTGRGSVSTINEEDQVLIGCMATQLRRNSNRGIAIGSYSGCGNNGIAIGYGAEADDNDITIGTATNTGTVKIAGKTISFNQDGTVTWS